MKKIFAALVVAALVGGVAIAAELKSGPQAGEKVPGPFHVVPVNGANAGEKTCLFCANGANPVAMVFARTPDCPQTQKLIKMLDEQTKSNEKDKMGSFVVFLSDEDKVSDKLKTWAEKEKIKNLIVAVDTPSGPEKYKIEKDADLTVVLYVDRVSKANWSFKKAEIKDADIDTIKKDISKILPEKK